MDFNSDATTVLILYAVFEICAWFMTIITIGKIYLNKDTNNIDKINNAKLYIYSCVNEHIIPYYIVLSTLCILYVIFVGLICILYIAGSVILVILLIISSVYKCIAGLCRAPTLPTHVQPPHLPGTAAQPL